MEFDRYQQLARATKIYPEKYNIIYPTLKLAGEAGEVAEKVGKVLRDNNGEFSDEKIFEIAKELGDLCWYIANLASDLGLSLNTIAEQNIQKLIDRKVRNTLHGSGDNR